MSVHKGADPFQLSLQKAVDDSLVLQMPSGGSYQSRVGAKLLERAGLITLVLDRYAHIVYCNDYLLRLTGWTLPEVVGRDWFETFVPADVSDLPTVFAELVADKPLAKCHHNDIRTRTGDRRFIRWHNALVRDDDGTVVGTESIGEDLTEVRDLRAREAQLSTALEHSREISVAVGVIMERLKVDRKSAFETLRQAARAKRRRVADVAAELLECADRLNSITTKKDC